MTEQAPLLRLDGVTKRFGGLVAVDGLDMAVAEGAIHGLIGPNGAGKSSAFDLVAGVRPVSAGRITFAGQDITAVALVARVRAGICRTFQTPRLFERMTSLETVMTGAHVTGKVGVLGGMFRIASKRVEERRLQTDAEALLHQVGLGTAMDAVAAELSYGQRRLLEIARALAARPKLLMLDEVTSGLNPVESASVAGLIRTLRAEGLTVIVVEHDMRFVMALCDRVTVLNFGRRLAEGTPDEVTANPDVIEAYLGTARPPGRSRRDLRRSTAIVPEMSV